MTPALEAEYRSGLENALNAGWDVLRRGGSSLDAVEAAVSWLEDFPLFNAGRGSVFTHEGMVEMDAAIMDGRTREAGAVAFVCNVQNPIQLARLVMERTEHVLLAGEGANQFASQCGIKMQPDELARVGRHRLHEAPLALGEHDVEGEGGLAGAGDARDDGELAVRNREREIFEIVLPGADDAEVAGGERERSLHEVRVGVLGGESISSREIVLTHTIGARRAGTAPWRCRRRRRVPAGPRRRCGRRWRRRRGRFRGSSRRT